MRRRLGMVVWMRWRHILESSRDTGKLLVAVDRRGGGRADGVEELVDGGALVVYAGVVHVVHGCGGHLCAQCVRGGGRRGWDAEDWRRWRSGRER